MPGVDLTTLATGALGFTIALAWSDAVGKTVRAALPARDEREAAQVALVYALLVTLVVVFIVAAVNRARQLAHLYRGGAGSTPAAAGTARAEGAEAAKRGGGAGALVHLWEAPAP